VGLPRIAIATGDPAGIGPEIALKAALASQVKKICRPLLVAIAARSRRMPTPVDSSRISAA